MAVMCFYQVCAALAAKNLYNLMKLMDRSRRLSKSKLITCFLATMLGASMCTCAPSHQIFGENAVHWAKRFLRYCLLKVLKHG